MTRFVSFVVETNLSDEALGRAIRDRLNWQPISGTMILPKSIDVDDFDGVLPAEGGF